MKYVLLYEAAPDFRAKVLTHLGAHRALWKTFARADPFVSAGIVARWTIREWNEVLVAEQT